MFNGYHVEVAVTDLALFFESSHVFNRKRLENLMIDLTRFFRHNSFLNAQLMITQIRKVGSRRSLKSGQVPLLTCEFLGEVGKCYSKSLGC